MNPDLVRRIKEEVDAYGHPFTEEEYGIFLSDICRITDMTEEEVINQYRDIYGDDAYIPEEDL